jgi:hypothetical protein
VIVDSTTVLKPERASYTPLDFTTWRESRSLVVAPEFQRRGVWGRPAKAYLIDTMIRGLPVPPIYLRVRQSKDKKRTVREVIDGQQRISSVLDFLDGKFALTPSLDKRYAGKEFAELNDADQDAVRNYSFICEVFSSVSDSAVLEIFARMNTYSVPLTAQELRNGRYFGFFKQAAYRLAHEHVEFWRQNKIMTERGIARMAEAELTSELMIMQLDGLQDKKKSINTFYGNYEDAFPEQERVETRFRATIDVLTETFGTSLATSNFRRTPLFYSLFGAVHHRRFGVPHVSLTTPRKALSESERKGLRSAVAKLSDVITLARQDEPVPTRYVRFVNAATTQTDNIQPRRTRLEQIYRDAF